MNATGLELSSTCAALESPSLTIEYLVQDPATRWKEAGLQISRNIAKQNILANFYNSIAVMKKNTEEQTAGNPGCLPGLQPGSSKAWVQAH